MPQSDPLPQRAPRLEIKVLVAALGPPNALLLSLWPYSRVVAIVLLAGKYRRHGDPF